MIQFSQNIKECTKTIFVIVWRMIKLLLAITIFVTIPIVIKLIIEKTIHMFDFSNYFEYIKIMLILILGIVVGVLININTKRRISQDTNTNDVDQNGWRKRDWIWITGILIVIILLLLTGWLSGKQVLSEHFSFGANLVSISLGLIAIFYAFNQTAISVSQNVKLDSTLNDMNLKVAQLASLKENLISMDSKIVEHYDSILDAIEKVEYNSANKTDDGNTDNEKFQSELINLRNKIMIERNESIANLSKNTIFLNDVYDNIKKNNDEIKAAKYKITYDTCKNFDFLEFEKNLFEFIIRYSFRIVEMKHDIEKNGKRIMMLSLYGKGKNNVDIIKSYIRIAGKNNVENIIIKKI